MSEQPQVRRDNQPRPDDSAREIVKRHRWPVRIWHWVNALTVFVMLMSGLMIFNAHPRLYWGALWRQRRLCLAGDRLDAAIRAICASAA